MQDSSILKSIPKQSIFSILPDSLEELSDHMEVQVLQPEQVFLNAGKTLNHLVIPLSDHLILKESNDKTQWLARGRTLALGHLLSGKPVPYSVSSPTYNRILCIDRSAFLEYLNRHPKHASYLRLMTQSGGFRNFKNFLIEKGLASDQIINLANDFETKSLRGSVSIESFILLNDDQEISLKSTQTNLYSVSHKVPKEGWLGGFSIIGSLKNPYDLDLERESSFLCISHSSVKKWIKDPYLLECIATDPWTKIERITKAHIWDKESECTPIEISKRFPLPMNPESFLSAHNDADSLPKTIFNLLNYIGGEAELNQIKLSLGASLSNFTLAKVANLFEISELQTRPFRFSKGQEIYSPVLIFKNNRLITLLEKVSPSEYLCMDSIDGFYQTSLNSLPENQVGEDALLIEKQPSIENSEASLRKISIDYVFQVLTQSRKYLVLISFCAMMTFALGALIPYLSQLLLDEVLRTSDMKTLSMCLIGMLVSATGIIIFNYLKNRLANSVNLEFDQKFSAFIYKKALQLKPGDLARIKVGGILNRIAEAEKIRHFFSTETLNKALSLFSVIIYLIILAFYSGYIALVPIVYVLVLFGIQKVLQSRIYRFNLEHFNVGTQLNTFISDSISKVLAIKAFNVNRKVSSEWDQIVVKSTEASQKATLESAKASAIVSGLSQITNIGALWLAVALVFSHNKNFSLGQLFAVTQYISHVITPLSGLVAFVVSFTDLKLSLDKINDILFPTGKVEAAPSKKHSVAIEGKIKLERVNFRYSETEPWVIKDASLTIYPGQMVALVGKSGSGKTTIANLIAGDNEPTSGKIFFDHYDKNFIEPKLLKSQIGYVQQNGDLFSGSIKSNIAYKDDSPDPQLLGFAKKYSYSEAFIAQFPQGEETFLAEGGLGLSGGQKQRLSIARVLYTDPKILLLDEATSALDSESESEIVKNIKELSKNRTTLVIAHRLSTIRDADVIFVVDQGQIVQQGTHNQLIRVEGVYKELFQDQTS